MRTANLMSFFGSQLYGNALLGRLWDHDVASLLKQFGSGSDTATKIKIMRYTLRFAQDQGYNAWLELLQKHGPDVGLSMASVRDLMAFRRFVRNHLDDVPSILSNHRIVRHWIPGMWRCCPVIELAGALELAGRADRLGRSL